MIAVVAEIGYDREAIDRRRETHLIG